MSKKLTYKKIISILKKELKDVSQFAYSDFDSNIDKLKKELGPFEDIDSHGGEGEGSDWWVVKYFKDHDIYIKVSGYYTSYSGTDFEGWDDCSQVFPKKKTIIVYEAK